MNTLKNIPKHHHAIALEWFKGADIEYKLSYSDEWESIDDPSWVSDCQYRLAQNTLQILDGRIDKSCHVWYRGVSGYEPVHADSNWDAIKKNPMIYSIKRPTIQYID